jgi:gamma-glutamyltranspeptidase/glutathione hydrolase
MEGMVATAFPEATRAGVEMLEKGGNAVDAACAAALALSVCEPQGSGLGGQSMAILHMDDRTVAVDGSSRAPSLAHGSKYRSETSRKLGYRAATTPTTVAVLDYLNSRYGQLDWCTVVQPAVAIAGNGYRITELQASLLQAGRKYFRRVPSRSGARYFLKDGDKPYISGEIFRQPDLADTLSMIAREGFETFYRGEIAYRIDADMRKHGGFLRAADLMPLPEIIEREPIGGSYRGFTVRAFPPPGSGEILVLILAMMERVPSDFLAEGCPEGYRLLAQVLHNAILEYRKNPRNPNTFHQIRDWAGWIQDLADRLVERIRRGESAANPVQVASPHKGETTHISVMDREGNAVGLTQSINLIYGSKAAAADLGFLYNSYIEAFQHGRPDHYYNLRPNAIPWPCAAPSIVFANGRPWIVLGSPGSQRIFSSMAQVLTGVIDRRLSICKAVTQPRLHTEEDGQVGLEADRFEPAIVDFLEREGSCINRLEPFSYYMGSVQAVLKRQTGGGFQGVADIRRDGSAAGPS